ncbi:hypothetical protein BDV26DRAFT_1948 [Aspergillus bertholletiae]|uniref:Uncharacterized protein n=1 Tax=Aspergillus bertholletiae TaxID=1226010 RepID=A0A5N7BQ97_9EURO|nr:hypothetical protein BDV26DRAFT_1948 [Aspergillus bertholletiae]
MGTIKTEWGERELLSLKMRGRRRMRRRAKGSLFALPHFWFSFGIYSLGHVARLYPQVSVKSNFLRQLLPSFFRFRLGLSV